MWYRAYYSNFKRSEVPHNGITSRYDPKRDFEKATSHGRVSHLTRTLGDKNGNRNTKRIPGEYRTSASGFIQGVSPGSVLNCPFEDDQSCVGEHDPDSYHGHHGDLLDDDDISSFRKLDIHDLCDNNSVPVSRSESRRNEKHMSIGLDKDTPICQKHAEEKEKVSSECV